MAQTFHKFRAESLEHAYRAMRRKLGEDALVVRTATITESGLRGLMGKKMIEVTASAPESYREVEERPISNAERRYLSSGNIPAEHQGLLSRATSATAHGAEGVQDILPYFQKLVREAQEHIKKNPEPAPTEKTTPKEDESALKKEMEEMRSMLQVLLAETPEGGLSPELAPYYRMLIDKGVSRELAAGLVAKSAKCDDDSLLRDPDVLLERFKMEIRKSIRVTGGIGLSADETRVIALIGPTGVGKTTNLAKLAAQFAVTEQAKVGLITADTYRVAATDQLKVYANIIGLEMKVAKEPKDMVAALRDYQGYDLVLIDTAGSSPFNQKQMETCRGLLEAAQPDESMLVLAASTPLDDLRAIVGRFSYLNPNSILFTKLDETRRYGPLYCTAVEAGLPLSYFSIGQDVPDDVVLAKSGMTANMVMETGEKRGTASTRTA